MNTRATGGDVSTGTRGRWGWFVLGLLLLLLIFGYVRGEYSETWLNGARF